VSGSESAPGFGDTRIKSLDGTLEQRLLVLSQILFRARSCRQEHRGRLASIIRY
jgi:hypothetical protein